MTVTATESKIGVSFLEKYATPIASYSMMENHQSY